MKGFCTGCYDGAMVGNWVVKPTIAKDTEDTWLFCRRRWFSGREQEPELSRCERENDDRLRCGSGQRTCSSVQIGVLATGLFGVGTKEMEVRGEGRHRDTHWR